MAAALVGDQLLVIRSVVAVGTHRPGDLVPLVEWCEAGHPLPDPRSLVAGFRARDIAARVPRGEGLLLLLSGGASALLAAPADDITLEDKRRTIEQMMRAGADIHALNTVRKHLSSIKGGQLALACRGTTTTLAVSDVVDDDISVVGSGPGVADCSTWEDAARALERWEVHDYPAAVRRRVAAGVRGELPDTPKPNAAGIARATGRVIASRRDALDGARGEAEAFGYRVVVLDEAITGEARLAAQRWYTAVQQAVVGTNDPVCVMSAGETTVRVTGAGKGGRNQEFVLALAESVAKAERETLVASVGTDGIDGPTDAAGAIVDRTTSARAVGLGLSSPRAYLDQNDSFTFFEALGDLIRTGRTDTNVGDLQVLLAQAP